MSPCDTEVVEKRLGKSFQTIVNWHSLVHKSIAYTNHCLWRTFHFGKAITHVLLPLYLHVGNGLRRFPFSHQHIERTAEGRRETPDRDSLHMLAKLS